MSGMSLDPKITLYSSSISNASARLRIALNLKNLPYRLASVNLSKDEQHSPDYKALNPAGTVPLLVVTNPTTDVTVKIGQSTAALEYLEEAFPLAIKLMPIDPAERAHIRTLISVLAADTHPLLTHRVTKAVPELCPGAQLEVGNTKWDKHWLSEGLKKFDNLLASADEKLKPGKFCVGDEPSLADVVLMPEMWMAKRIGADLSDTSHIPSIFDNMCANEDVKKEEQKAEEQ